MHEMGWTITESEWQVESYWPNGRLKEKIAYTMYFFAAEAAYEAAVVKLHRERIMFRHRGRVIRRNWDGPL